MLHFRPKKGGVWDVIPFYHDGIYHAFLSGLGSCAYDDPSPGRIGFFVENGGVTVKDVKIMSLK